MPQFSRFRSAWSVAIVVGAMLLVAYARPGAQATRSEAQPAAAGRTWVTAWGTSQQTLAETRINNATVRMIARVTIPGDAIRIRLDNTFGTSALTVARGSIGVRIQGAAVAAGSSRALAFSGSPHVTIPAGGSVWSDAVALPVLAQQDLAVSLHIPGADVRPSQHTNAVVTSYRSADGSGDLVGEEGRVPFTVTTTAMWWLKAIDVETVSSSGAIVAFGDSITDGTCTTLDAHDRWEDLLAVRLGVAQGSAASNAPPLRSVVNEGIGGNTVTREGLTQPPDSPPGIERLDRDVLSHHGVTDVVVFMGTNDLRRDATAASVNAGLAEIVRKVRASGFRTIGVTMIPRHNVAPSANNSGWNDQKTRIRHDVNAWIRQPGSFDRVLDFDAVVRDSEHPDLLQARFNCGDGIHPSPAGYFAIGRSIELSLFRANQ
jgi:lysophospholipase L1-like esterase